MRNLLGYLVLQIMRRFKVWHLHCRRWRWLEFNFLRSHLNICVKLFLEHRCRINGEFASLKAWEGFVITLGLVDAVAGLVHAQLDVVVALTICRTIIFKHWFCELFCIVFYPTDRLKFRSCSANTSRFWVVKYWDAELGLRFLVWVALGFQVHFLEGWKISILCCLLSLSKAEVWLDLVFYK